MITRAVNGGIYALDPTYIRRFDAPRAAAFHGRPRFPFSATAPQHHVRQTRRVICIKMESNTVRCEARSHRARFLAHFNAIEMYAKYLIFIYTCLRKILLSTRKEMICRARISRKYGIKIFLILCSHFSRKLENFLNRFSLFRI